MSARYALEHDLWKSLRRDEIVGKRFLLACSGGADSVALVRAFLAVRPATELVVAHVHHGGDDPARDAAAVFVTTMCHDLDVRFEMRRFSGPALRSEKECRDFRRGVLEELRRDVGADFIVTGHHRRDVLETRLLRLLRGTGPEGLPALKNRRGVWYRPFLEVESGLLREYLRLRGQEHIEDPTNGDPRFLRNWLRHVWLPALEGRMPGATNAMARSFENIVMALDAGRRPEEPVISRAIWESATRPERLRLLAECLRAAGQDQMTRGQLEEILRRLDNRRKEHRFRIAGCVWSVDMQQIQARLQGKSSEDSI